MSTPTSGRVQSPREDASMYLTEWQDPEGHRCDVHPDEWAVVCTKYVEGWSFRCAVCADYDDEADDA